MKIEGSNRPIEVTETFTVEMTHTFTTPAYMEATLTDEDRVKWLERLYSGVGTDKAWVRDHKVFIREAEEWDDDDV